MTWIHLRSRRDPRVWGPPLLALLVLLPLGLLALGLVDAWLADLRAKAASDPDAARAEAVAVLRLAGWSLAGLTVAFAALLGAYFRRAAREARLPPSGPWSFGAWRALVGPRARRMARAGLVLAALLVVSSLGFALALEGLIRVLGADGGS